MYLMISNHGRAMPPFFIIEGINLSQLFFEALKKAKIEGYEIPGAFYTISGHLPPIQNIKINKTSKGPMTREVSKRYMLEIFLKKLTEAKKHVLVFVDGHDSRFDTKILIFLRNNGIFVIQEPSNASQRLQVLD